MASKYARFEFVNSFDYSMCGILQEKLYMYRIGLHITDRDLLTNSCWNDDVLQLGPFRFQLLFRFVQISRPIPTCCYQLDSNLVNLEATAKMR